MSTTMTKLVSDLRDYNKVLRGCVNGEPVILTKNGYGVFVVMSIDEYSEMLKLCAIRQMGRLNKVIE
jgi:prevent-host-death family protein